MLSARLIRQLADSALLGRLPVVLAAPHRLSLCSTATRRAVSTAAISSRHEATRAAALPATRQCVRFSSSSTRWKSRQGRDHFAREAKIRGLKSRAAFKLLEMNQRYRLFRAGNTVVDLGYAPGSWSQVAVDRTQPGGRVIGIDVIPAQPPRGVSTIQGNFLSEAVQAEVRAYVQDPERGRPVKRQVIWSGDEEAEAEEDGAVEHGEHGEHAEAKGYTEAELEQQEMGYIDRERRAPLIAREDEEDGHSHGETEHAVGTATGAGKKKSGRRAEDEAMGRVVDVVLSDMSAPWDQTSGFHKRSITEPYLRMMNTSGMAFRDHAGSMDLCNAALTFAFDTLRTGGNFVCKFYQGAEDKALEKKLRRMFEKVFREKPESSRSESKESFFVALRRKPDPTKEDVFGEV